MVTPAELRSALDAESADYRLLEHPFYRAWSAGTLGMDDLAFYSAQYWRQVEAFPGYLQALADRLPEGSPGAVVESNLKDERDDDHPGLWLDFAVALGVSRGEVRTSVPEPETAACVGTFADGVHLRSLPFALGMLYAYESQTPEVATTKIEGLARHYGIDGPAVSYFALHGDLDVEHSRELAEALAALVETEEDLADARAGARAGAAAVYGLLSGVTRARDICTSNPA